MELFEIIRYVLAILETGSLIAALVFGLQAIREKREDHAQQRKTAMIKAFVFFGVYLVLNRFRAHFL
jgi:uncharacterized membrane protein YozB (DUF420 family)